MVHPKGHIMARIKDLILELLWCGKGLWWETPRQWSGCRNPQGDPRARPRRSLQLCWIAPSLRAVSTAPPVGEMVPSAKLFVQQLCFVTVPFLLLPALGILGVGVRYAW